MTQPMVDHNVSGPRFPFNTIIILSVASQQTKLYYRNIITILSFAVFNISSAYYRKRRAGKHDILFRFVIKFVLI